MMFSLSTHAGVRWAKALPRGKFCSILWIGKFIFASRKCIFRKIWFTKFLIALSYDSLASLSARVCVRHSITRATHLSLVLRFSANTKFTTASLFMYPFVSARNSSSMANFVKARNIKAESQEWMNLLHRGDLNFRLSLAETTFNSLNIRIGQVGECNDVNGEFAVPPNWLTTKVCKWFRVKFLFCIPNNFKPGSWELLHAQKRVLKWPSTNFPDKLLSEAF